MPAGRGPGPRKKDEETLFAPPGGVGQYVLPGPSGARLPPPAGSRLPTGAVGAPVVGGTNYGSYAPPRTGYPYDYTRNIRGGPRTAGPMVGPPAWQMSPMALQQGGLSGVDALDLAYLMTPGSAGAYYGLKLQMAGQQPVSGAPDINVPTTGAGGPGGSWQANLVPPGIDEKWYRQFMEEHGGKTPEQFYSTVGRYGEGLIEALRDRDWGNQFAQSTGRQPTDDDWTAHYYASRPGARWAAMSDAERREEKRKSRNQWLKEQDAWAYGLGWRGKKGGQRGAFEYGMMAAVKEGKAEYGWSTQQTKEKEQEELEEARGPLYVPPQFSWR